MAVTEAELAQAEACMEALRRAGHAISARYDRRASRIVVRLNTELELAFSPALAEGLAGATPNDLAEIEIAQRGLACIGRSSTPTCTSPPCSKAERSTPRRSSSQAVTWPCPRSSRRARGVGARR